MGELDIWSEQLAKARRVLEKEGMTGAVTYALGETVSGNKHIMVMQGHRHVPLSFAVPMPDQMMTDLGVVPWL